MLSGKSSVFFKVRSGVAPFIDRATQQRTNIYMTKLLTKASKEAPVVKLHYQSSVRQFHVPVQTVPWRHSPSIANHSLDLALLSFVHHSGTQSDSKEWSTLEGRHFCRPRLRITLTQDNHAINIVA